MLTCKYLIFLKNGMFVFCVIIKITTLNSDNIYTLHTILSISSSRNTGLLTPAVFRPWMNRPGIDPIYVLRCPRISDWSATPPREILDNTKNVQCDMRIIDLSKKKFFFSNERTNCSWLYDPLKDNQSCSVTFANQCMHIAMHSIRIIPCTIAYARARDGKIY